MVSHETENRFCLREQTLTPEGGNQINNAWYSTPKQKFNRFLESERNQRRSSMRIMQFGILRILSLKVIECHIDDDVGKKEEEKRGTVELVKRMWYEEGQLRPNIRYRRSLLEWFYLPFFSFLFDYVPVPEQLPITISKWRVFSWNFMLSRVDENLCCGEKQRTKAIFHCRKSVACCKN